MSPLEIVIFRRLFNSAMLILCTILKHTTLSERDILNEVREELIAFRAGAREQS